VLSKEPVVFVIDDDPTVRLFLRRLLEIRGRLTKDFDSAESFLDQYSPSQPGCLLVDVRMPGLGGIMLQKSLRHLGYTIPMIFMTGYGDVSTAVRVLKAGALDYIEKPFNNEELLDLIDVALDKEREIRLKKDEQEFVIAKYQNLTPREKQIMALVTGGAKNKSIARDLDISIKTVETHRAKVMRKMAAKSVANLTTMASRCS